MCASLTVFAVALTSSFELAEATRRNINITTILGHVKDQTFLDPKGPRASTHS